MWAGVRWGSTGQGRPRANPCRGTMVYWHGETVAANVGKRMSNVCSEIK